MKKSSIITAAVCLVGLLGSTVRPISAAVTAVLTVTLPHSAMVGDVMLPAGKYSVRDLQDSGNSSVFEFLSDSGRSASVVVNRIAVPGNQVADKTEVIVVSDGDKYQVDKIWLSGVEHGYQLQSSNAR
jgi:hypothetical protein